MFTIRRFQQTDRQTFVELNLAWIDEHFCVEETDREQLEQLDESILAPGGQILVAEIEVASGVEVVGVGAIVPPHHQHADGRVWLELIKMAVRDDVRGKGIGRALVEALIAEARAARADAIWLETNAVLASALRLYERCGFRHLTEAECWPTPYQRCNVQMTLEL